MDSDNSSPPAIPSTPAWLLWARALLAVAILGAGYLAWVAIHNGPAAGCGPESGCDKVLHSRWAYWLDLPVRVPAVLVYLALLGVTVLLQKRPAPDDQRGSWAAIIILSVIVAGAALWFVGLQVFVIKAFCQFCLTAHAVRRGVPRQAIFSLVLIGLAGVAVLAGGQVLVQKQRNVVKLLKHTAAATSTNQAASQANGGLAVYLPQSPNARLIAPRTLSLYSNQFLIKFDEMTVVG